MGERRKRCGAAVLRAGVALLLSGAALTVAAPGAEASTLGWLSANQATPGNGLNPSWVVSSSLTSSNLTCEIRDPGGALLTSGACAPGDPITLPAPLPANATNGGYTATVTDLDAVAASAPDVSDSDTYVLDTQAVTPTLTQTPAITRGSGSSITWSWTTPEAGVRCQLVSSPAQPTVDFAERDCTPDAGSLTITAPADATYTFTVLGVDALGNPSAPVSTSYTRDATGPVVSGLAVTPGTVGHLADPQATWTGTAAGDTATCQVTDSTSAVVVGPVVGCTSPWTVPAGSLGAGTYTVTVDAVDDLGTSGTSASTTFVVDLTGPVVSGLAVSPGVVSHAANPQATWSGTVGSDTVSCRVEDAAATTVVGPVTCSSPWTVPAGSLPEGNYSVVVGATDSLGNVGAEARAGFSVDLTGPSVAPVITAGPGATGNDDTPSWTFTVGPGETAQCEFVSSLEGVLSSWRSCGDSSGPNTVSVQSLLGRAQVTYTLHIQAIDALGNLGAEVTSDYLYDATPPAAPGVTVAPATGQSRSFTATWAGTEAARCTVTNHLGVVVVGPDVACSSGATFTVPAVEDDYQLAVTLTDAAGNTSTPGTAGYRYDITAPLSPRVTGPTAGNSTTPAFSLAGTESGETLLCTWTLPAASPSGSDTVLGPTPCSGASYRPSPALPADGPWTLSVVGRDLAGNTSAATVSGYLLDTGPPAAPTLSLAPGLTSPGNDLTPTWQFTTEVGATVECELRLGTAVLSPWSDCTGGTVTYNLTPVDPTVLPDGTYTVWVRATDGSGNTGAAASSSYSLDTVPPGAPSWILQPAGPSAAPASWEFSTGVDDAECQLEYEGVVVSSWASCSSPWTPALTADGDYALSIRAVDAAGNRGPEATSTPFLRDTTGPGTPVLTQSPASPAPDHAPVVGFSIDSSAVAADCRITLRGSPVVDWADCASPWVADLTGAADDDYSLEIRAVDAAGNTSAVLAVPYTLDSSAPPVVGFITGPGGPARGRAPSFEFPVAAGASAECAVQAPGAAGLTWSSCAPPCPPTAATSCTATYVLNLAGLPDGSYRLYVRLVDAAGNPSADKYTSYVLDTAAPAAPAFGLLPPSPTADAVTDWRWTAEVGTSAQCQVTSGSRTMLGWRPCTSPFRVNLGGQPDGTYTLWVRVTDAAGNTSRSRTASIVRDTTPPAVVLVSEPPATTTSRSLRWTWTTEPGASTTCLLTRGAVVVADWRPCSGSFAANLTGEPDGTYRLSVRPVDRAGNMGKVTSSAVTVTTRVTPPGSSGGGKPPTVTPPAPKPPVVTPGELSHPPVVRPPVVTPPTAPPTAQPTEKHPVPSGGSLVPPAPISRVPDLLGRAAVRSLDRPQVPVIIVVLIVAFLLIQNRIDRRDPKLAQAPLGAEPTLGFGRLGGVQ